MKVSINKKMKCSTQGKQYSFASFTYKLKRIIIVVIWLMIACSSEANAANVLSAAPLARPQEFYQQATQGLFQRLIKIKYSSELYLITIAKEANKLNKPEILDTALAVYNTIRWNLDGWVYQLSGDMVAANNPRKFKQLNDWALSNKAAVTSAAAAHSLESIETLCTLYLPAFSLISEKPEYNSQTLEDNLSETTSKNINLTTNVFYLIKDSYSLIKGLSDLKTQKTMALVDILDQMRLINPQELLKQIK